MADKPAAPAGAEAPKPKSKKMLIIILAVVLLLVVAGGAAAFFLMKGSGEDEEGGEEQQTSAAAKKSSSPPVFLPIDPMVANLTDPTTNSMRYAQIGITFRVDDAATSDRIKAYMPSIRDGILRRLARRTPEELLRPEGLDALSNDILLFVREETGLPEIKGHSPIQAVLFGSLIVQ
jgi:flagellar protein FliL